MLDCGACLSITGLWNMALILGIDPGSRRTGYGVVDVVGNRSRAVAFGTIATTHKEIPPRLGEIFAGIDQVVKELDRKSVV